MARGFLSGVIAGALVSGLGLSAVSVLSGPPPKGAGPQTGGAEVPEGSAFNQPQDDTVAAIPSSSEAPDAGTVSEVTAPEPDDLAALQDGDTETAAQPETGQADSALSEPAASDGAAGVSVDSEAPVLPSPQSSAPETPVSEDELSISTDPAQPATPEVSEEDAAFPDSETGADEAGSDTEIAAVTPEPQADPVPETVESEQMSQPAEPDTDPVVDEPDVAESTGDEIAQPSEAETQPETAATDEPSQTEPAEPVADSAATDEGADSTSTIGDLAPEVKTNRLPSVGDEPEQGEPPADPAGADQEEVTEAGEDPVETAPPLVRFASEFENPEDKPLMSIILIDDGSSPVGLQALESFPYPLSFAIPANRQDADDAMVTYRAAGFEVLALTDLPEGAGAQDAEVAMQSIFTALPEVVGVMEGTGSGLQSSRAAAEQLAPILLDSGHGVVLFPKGLNTAQKLLAREGVPSAAVFRDFDAKGQNATVIRRFLDQAAFKAGQEEAGVVMVGRLRPDTVSALLLWGLQDRADRVALAPISAILSDQE